MSRVLGKMMGRRLGVALISVCAQLSAACASTPVSPTSVSTPPKKPIEKPKVGRPDLTADEELVKKGLSRRVALFSDKMGERHPDKLWELAEAADYLAGELEGLGFALERQGYETSDVAAQNLSVTVPGGTRGDEVLILSTHYDTAVGRPQGGASGPAILLEIARLMRDASLERTLRIVFLSMGEAPHGNGEGRGATHFAREFTKVSEKKVPQGPMDPATQVSRVEAVGAIHLRDLDDFRVLDTEKTSGVSVVDVRATPGARTWTDGLKNNLNEDPFRLHWEPLAPNAEESDATVFGAAGIPSVLLSGEALDGKAGESSFDVEEMALFTMRLRRGIGEILGEKPTNDGMVTPLSGGLR